MVTRRTIEDGLNILISITESDAFREMRERLRKGANRVADSERVPRVVAGSAGILAVLLEPAAPAAKSSALDDGPAPEREPWEKFSEVEVPTATCSSEPDVAPVARSLDSGRDEKGASAGASSSGVKRPVASKLTGTSKPKAGRKTAASKKGPSVDSKLALADSKKLAKSSKARTGTRSTGASKRTVGKKSS